MSERIDLDEELAQQVMVPEYLLELKSAGIGPHMVKNPTIKPFIQFVFDYLDEYGNPPNDTVINHEWEKVPRTGPTVQAEFLADKLRERYIRSRHKDIINELVDSVEPDEFVDSLISNAHNIWSQVSSKKHILSSEDYREVIEEFKNYAVNNAQGATYGFKDVDEHTGGAGPGHLTFFVARPKRYKSWFLLNAFIEQRRQGLIPILFSLELTEKDMYKRLMCLVSGVSYSRMVKNSLMPTEWKQIETAMEEFHQLGPAYIVHPGFEDRKVSNFVMESQRVGADVVLIDQLSFIHPEKNSGRSDENTKDIVHAMKVAATRQNIPYICVCQFNREAAQLEDLAGADKIGLSRSIEETADLLIALHRNEDEADLNIVRMRILEGRYCKSNAVWGIKVNLQNKTQFTFNGPVISRASD
jgi:replicative DNA helicase